jgi:hypothetical protein
MRKIAHYILLTCFIALVLSGCMLSTTTPPPASPTIVSLSPTGTATQAPTATPTMEPTATPLPSATPSPTITFTPQATLDPTQAAYSIRQYLTDPIDCDLPCFLGIVPEETTYSEAAAIFSHLGLTTWTIVKGERTNFGNEVYLFESGLDLLVHLVIYNEIVRSFTVDSALEKQQEGIQREWSVFSPEVLIRRYGQPAKIQFFMGRLGGVPQQFDMDMYFDQVDLIVSYGSYRTDIRDTIHLCPGKDQFTDFRAYLGKDPENPPLELTPLEDVSELTISEFSEILTSDEGDGCVELNPDAFP